MKLIFVFLFMSPTLFSQSLENLQGQYLCEADGFFHLYEFNKRKLVVTLNFKEPFIVKHTIFYSFGKYKKTKDSLIVSKTKHEMERLVPLNAKDDKVSYIHSDVDSDSRHLWVLEKMEADKLFIKIIPGRETYFKGWKFEADSNLYRHIILKPILN